MEGSLVSYLSTFFLSLFLLSYGHLAAAQNRVVYDQDNREDLFLVDSYELKMLAASTAIMVRKRSVRQTSNSTFELLTEQSGVRSRLCRSERFYSQPSVAGCTGFLIAKDLIATAGHCIQDDKCGIVSWIFDFKMLTADIAKREFTAESVYHCKKVVESVKVGDLDYAVVRLDRSVNGREPLTIRRDGLIEKDEQVFIIGHPLGLPIKISKDAYVRDVDPNKVYFTTNLDSFAGNSGSPVFNAITYEVEGILVRGATDFEWDSENGCRKVKVCRGSECRGEDVTMGRHIVEFVQ